MLVKSGGLLLAYADNIIVSGNGQNTLQAIVQFIDSRQNLRKLKFRCNKCDCWNTNAN